MFIRSRVTYSDGKSETITLNTGSLTSDQAHTRHQEAEARFWAGWKRVTGGAFQALAARNMVEAIVEEGYLTPL